MKMILRWHGETDPVSLKYIAQIPGVHGIVTSLYHLPLGEIWPIEKIRERIDEAARYGLKLEIVDSFRIHEDIKRGYPSRDELIPKYCENIRNLAAAGIKIICYNFMPVFDWTRTEMEYPLPDGSNTLAFDIEKVQSVDPEKGIDLPGWGTNYSPVQLQQLLASYKDIDEAQLWENFKYFLNAVVPVAEEAGIVLALHPDDPPRPIFGLPRVVKNIADYQRILRHIDSPYNAVTLCTGSLGSGHDNDIPAIIRELRDRIVFVHARNVMLAENGDFYEAGHITDCGSLDMGEIVRALHDIGFNGYIRPDHGRMIWGENGVAGYGLYDRALGAMYLQGLWEGIEKQKNA